MLKPSWLSLSSSARARRDGLGTFPPRPLGPQLAFPAQTVAGFAPFTTRTKTLYLGANLRKQFLIPADEVYLNNGTVGSSPRARACARSSKHMRLAKKLNEGPTRKELSHLGIRFMETSFPRSAWLPLWAVTATRDRFIAQRHRGEQLHCQRRGPQAGRRSF